MIVVGYIIPPPNCGQFRKFIERFALNYKSFKPSVPHQLHLIFKDWGDTDKKDILSLFPENVVCLDHPNSILDIGSFINVSNSLTNEDYFVGLGTYSYPKCFNWLDLMYQGVQLPQVGLVGATGSYEKGAVGISFPNYHIRTSCFMVKAELFNSFKFNHIRGKDDAYQFEHGPDSLTHLVLRLNLKCLVIGKNGNFYDKENWGTSETFRSGNQVNLICGDNHTDSFDNASAHERSERFAEAFIRG